MLLRTVVSRCNSLSCASSSLNPNALPKLVFPSTLLNPLVIAAVRESSNFCNIFCILTSSPANKDSIPRFPSPIAVTIVSTPSANLFNTGDNPSVIVIKLC